MAYVVTGDCDGCKYTDCVEICPVEAFHEADTMLYINPEVCIDCDACVGECPVDAIYPESDLPHKWRHYVEINRSEYARYPIITVSKTSTDG